jgi:cation:H+ antiporter
MSYLLFIAGIGLLILSGAALVEGASNIAARHNVSPALIGLTLVAFGTSLPELAVNVSAVNSGKPGLAVGNIFGSNIANIGLVLGTCVALRGFTVESRIIRREIPLLLLISAIVTVLAGDGTLRDEAGYLDRGDALVLMLLLLIFIYTNIWDMLQVSNDDPLLTQASARGRRRLRKRNLAYIAGGAVGLWLAGSLTVENAVFIAQDWGVPETIIGLSILAIGTSLPELVTAVAAALRGEASLALGNVVGSNLMNVLFILPSTALLQPLPLENGSLLDILCCLAFTALLALFAYTSQLRLSRWEGAVLLAGYFGFIAWRYAA